MPDYVSTGGDWKQIPNPQQASKKAKEEASKLRVFPAETKAVSTEKTKEPSIKLKPSKKTSFFTPSKKGK